MSKTNTIITIGREFGSGGHEIGERLSEKLEIPFYDKEMLIVHPKTVELQRNF